MFYFLFYFFVVARPALVVGMQDNEYTDAQVGDAGGLFKSLDPAPCGAVPAYLIQCCSSSLPHPVLQFQSTSSSAAVPVYLIQCSGSMQSASPVQKTLIFCSLFLFLYILFFQISVYLNNNYYMYIFFTIIYTTIFKM